LTEDGKIEFYKVKFGDITETLSAKDFVVEKTKLHEHGTKNL